MDPLRIIDYLASNHSLKKSNMTWWGGGRQNIFHMSQFFLHFLQAMMTKIKFWGLSSGQLQRSYPDPAFAASPSGTGIRTQGPAGRKSRALPKSYIPASGYDDKWSHGDFMCPKLFAPNSVCKFKFFWRMNLHKRVKCSKGIHQLDE